MQCSCNLSVLTKMSFTSSKKTKLFASFSLFLLLVVPAFGLNLDGTLLLSFKYSILSDPLSVLDNWDYSDANPCLWTGVACADIDTDKFRVISLTLPNSKLTGSIPENLFFIPHLRTLDLSNNFLNGTLPSSISIASELQILSLSNNGIYGALHEFIAGPKNLKLLNLSHNAFIGKIPSSLTSLQNLTVVSLSGNDFSGPVPSGVQSVEFLDLSSNSLTGSLPLEFGGMSLKYLNLSSNKLSGSVPQEFISKIPQTAIIDLSFNSLSGRIPESTPLLDHKTITYEGNADLCGKPLDKLCPVPSTLSTQPNISSNTSSAAIAVIPKPITTTTTTIPNSPSTSTNQADIQPQHGLKPGAIAGIAIGDLAGITILAIIFLYVFQKRRKRNAETKESISSIPTTNAYNFTKDPESTTLKESKNLPIFPCLSITNGEETSTSDSDDNNNNVTPNPHEQIMINKSIVIVDGETQLELETLLKASAYVLSSRTNSSTVYKAVIDDGTAFAVRRIGESGVEREKEFENQVRAIAKLGHRNLVRVKGFYWGENEKLVIYEYVSNGSLANANYRKNGSSPHNLSFEVRLKIAKGVAKGLTYIHEKKHVHGNIKPSNILLTDDMEPIISDFGLQWLVHGKKGCKFDGSRHFGSKRSNDQGIYESPYIAPAGFVGCTSAYHAPESLNNLKSSPKWDVYSFGILLLELLTGKAFSDWELIQCAAGSVADDPAEILRMTDVALRGDVAGREEALVAWFKLGFGCASLVAHKRPSMKDALHVLEKIPCYQN